MTTPARDAHKRTTTESRLEVNRSALSLLPSDRILLYIGMKLVKSAIHMNENTEVGMVWAMLNASVISDAPKKYESETSLTKPRSLDRIVIMITAATVFFICVTPIPFSLNYTISKLKT